MQLTNKRFYLILFICSYAFSILLLSLDKDVQTPLDLVQWKALIVVSYYALPAFFFAGFIFKSIKNQRIHILGKMLFSSAIGFPLGFISTMIFFFVIT